MLGCTTSVPAPDADGDRHSGRRERANVIGAAADTARRIAAARDVRQPSRPNAARARRGRGRADDVRDAGDATIRVLIASGPTAPRIASPGRFDVHDARRSLVARAGRNEVWRIERSGGRVRAIRPDGVPTIWSDAPMMARPQGGALLSVGGKPYRGDLALSGGDTGVVVVNVVKIDDYVRGVVPLEIGTKAESDSAAVQAQAVTARSYAYIHLSSDPISRRTT